MADGDIALSIQGTSAAHLIDIQIGSRLRICRKKHGMTQFELAEKVGVSYQQVQKYERGTNRISGSVMTLAAKALGVSFATLFGEGESSEQTELLSSLSAPGAVELLTIYYRLSPEGRKVLLGAAHGFDPPSTIVDD